MFILILIFFSLIFLLNFLLIFLYIIILDFYESQKIICHSGANLCALASGN
jgi:hypothetical protein